jgi:hypothetical protein
MKQEKRHDWSDKLSYIMRYHIDDDIKRLCRIARKIMKTDKEILQEKGVIR